MSEAATAARARPALAVMARAADTVTRHVVLSLGVILIVQIVATIALFFSINRNGWLTYQGGDQIWLVTSGWLLGDGTIGYALTSHGWPMLLAPLTWITGSSSIELLPLTTVLQVGVLGPIATLAVYDIGARLAGRLAGLWCAAAFVAAPFLAIPYFVQRYHDSWVDQFLPQALGLTQQADFPSVVAVLVSVAFTVRALQAGALREAVLAGTFAGVALALKPANALFLGGPFLAFLLARRYLHAGLFAAALGPALLALTVWKAKGLGEVPLFALEEVKLAAGLGRSGRRLGDVVVRPHGAPELRHLEAEHVEPAGVHLEREGDPVPAARGRGRGRPALGARGRALPRLAARLRGRQGRRGRGDGRVGELLAADHARASGVRPARGCDPASRPDPRPADGRRDLRHSPAGVPGLRTTSFVVAFLALVPIAVLAASTIAHSVHNATPPPDFVSSEVIVDEIGVPADADVVSVDLRREGATVELAWTDSTTRARTFYRVYRASPIRGFPDTVCQLEADAAAS